MTGKKEKGEQEEKKKEKKNCLTGGVKVETASLVLLNSFLIFNASHKTIFDYRNIIV